MELQKSPIKSRGKAPGTAREAAAALERDDLRAMYRAMLRVRIVDERCINLQRQGRIGFYVPSTGQEAAAIGSGYALRPTDWVCPSYREQGVWLLRGYPLQSFVNQLFGNAGDVIQGRQMPNHMSGAEFRMLSVSSPIGTQITHAAGLAMAARYRGDDAVVMSYFGDGCTSSSEFHTGLNFAGVYKTPVVFVCQNNGWAITVPFEKQTASESIAVKARAYGFPGVQVDGNDVLAVHAAAAEAVARARQGGGPTLIEALTFRMGPHSTSDDPNRYRDPAACEPWKERDPIQRFRALLLERGAIKESEDQGWREDFKNEVNACIKEAESQGPPPLESMFRDVYAEPTKQLEEQKNSLLAIRKSPKKGGH